MCIKEEYRKEFKCIKSGDTIIAYRSPQDMRFGTVQIEEYDDHFLILGQNKNNGGNTIKFAKIYPEFPHWNQMTAQFFCGAGILMSILTGFSTVLQLLH